MRLTKRNYLLGFAGAVMLLALVRLLFPQVAADSESAVSQTTDEAEERTEGRSEPVPDDAPPPYPAVSHPVFDGPKHPIRSVPSYAEAFPDTNAVQLVAARRWGVKPVLNRQDAEKRKRELVYVGSSPYYHVDPLHQSIPYLVPRAAVLLHDIGTAFFDSLYIKGIPLHRLIVTSVLRTQEDVARLRRFNGNATENSCHLYGTTFDICYNRYKTVYDPDDPPLREVRNDTLKYVLSEVLRDMRRQGRCFIKYERKQGCFHMTVR